MELDYPPVANDAVLVRVKSAAVNPADLAKIAAMIVDKVISTQLAAVFPIDQLQDALETFATGGVKGKIGIVIED